VVYLLPRKPLLRFCLVVCATLPFIRLALLLSGEKTWAVRQYTHTRFDTLLYGAIVAIVIRESGLLEKFRTFSIAAAVASTVALAAMAIKDGFVPYESLQTMVVGYSAFGVVFAVLIGYLVSKTSRLSDLLSNSTLRWFGTYSYGIYVFHWPVTQAFQSLIEPRLANTKAAWIGPVACFLTVLAASSLVAYLSFVLYESHFLKLKRFFAYSRAAGTLPVSNDLLNLATGVQPNPPSAVIEETAAKPQSE
jgi:peptidoglycan/LPS O-acetylase OafA/YrhL